VRCVRHLRLRQQFIVRWTRAASSIVVRWPGDWFGAGASTKRGFDRSIGDYPAIIFRFKRCGDRTGFGARVRCRMSAESFDANEFRRALGSFATGVTIITTRDTDGVAAGLTVNSFNSVSLNPPLVLWSLSTGSQSLPAFQSAPHWAVHVLAADQHHLSGRFATRGKDKFAGLETDAGIGAVPLLHGCMARFQCRTAFQYEGGDHVIFIGEVLSFDYKNAAPLVFHGGRYAHATVRDPLDLQRAASAGTGIIDDDFLGTQLSRNHFRFFGQLRRALAELQLSEEDFYLLAALADQPGASEAELGESLAGIVDVDARAVSASLMRRGWIQATSSDQNRYELTAAGRAMAVRVANLARALEQQILLRLNPGEAAALKSLLARLQNVIDPAARALWQEKSAAEEIAPAARQ
jgi:3-hydroxy-9,10-secoandrosta-1,3,5(10)-triene-9,17-dione monooxygenase reductase component